MRTERIAIEAQADFTPDLSPTEGPVGEALAPLLLRRTRLLLWLMFFIGLGFTAIELLLAPALGPHTMVKFCGLTSMALVLFTLHRPWGVKHVYGFSVTVVVCAYIATALSAIVSPSHEYATSSTLFVAAALTTATLLPWGAWAQLLTMVTATLCLGANILSADGSLAVAESDPGVAVLLAFASSVAIAREMHRSRGEAIRHYHFRRHAEREVRALNASLEARVLHRTSELLEANEKLAAEIGAKEKMAEALVASQQRLLDVVDHSTALITLKDTEGRYLLVNREFERIAGVDRERTIGRTDEELFGTERAAALRERQRQVLAGEGPHSFDDELRLADGARSFFTVAFPLHGLDGRPYGLGTISTDITRLRRAEETARAHQEDLAHVQRLHLVNQMAALLAHEIHQPLGAIANYAQGGVHRLRDRRVELSELLPVLEKIAAEALRAGGILRGVRRLVGRQASVLEPVDVNAAVNDAIHVLELSARRNHVRLEMAVTSTQPFIIADKTQVEQVLVNLLLNGIDAASGTAGARQVQVDTQIEDGAVAITVSDNGPGIPPEAADKLFTPFYTTKAHGLGMGLAISRSIVEAHGGALSHTSNAMGGAAFRIAFPLAAGGAVHGATELRPRS